MRKNFLFFSAAIFLLFTSLAMGYFLSVQKEKIAPSQKEKRNMEVAATIFPLYAIVKEIGGEEIETRLLLPMGASPHAFEITPGLLRELQNTEAVFYIGHGLDDWARGITASLPKARAITVDEGITFRAPEEEKHIEILPAEEEEEEDSEDPHYWMDPLNGIVIARFTARVLGELDPVNALLYQTRAEKFSERISRRDAEWKKQLSEIENKNILTFHDAYFYFANHFGLTIAGAFEPFPGKEPTPRYLAKLAEVVKEKGLREVFLEPQFSGAVIQSFAKDYGLLVGVLDPEGQGYAGAETYDDLIDYNVRTIVDRKKALQ